MVHVLEFLLLLLGVKIQVSLTYTIFFFFNQNTKQTVLHDFRSTFIVLNFEVLNLIQFALKSNKEIVIIEFAILALKDR